MGFKEYSDRTNKEVLISDVNNILNSNDNYIKDDNVTVTITDTRKITIGAGTAVFSGVEVAFIETELTFTAADTGDDRIDIITIDNAGLLEITQGIAALQPETPAYDPDTDICLCSVRLKQSRTLLDSTMVNTNYLLKKTPVVSYSNTAMTNFINYQQMEILEIEAMTTMAPTGTFQIVNDAFTDSTGLLNLVNTSNTTATYRNYRYYATTTGDYVEIDLPTITGTYTHSALIVSSEKYYSDESITYTLIQGATTDASMALDTKNALVNVTSNPTTLKINLVKGAVSYNKYPKVLGFSIIFYKA